VKRAAKVTFGYWTVRRLSCLYFTMALVGFACWLRAADIVETCVFTSRLGQVLILDPRQPVFCTIVLSVRITELP